MAWPGQIVRLTRNPRVLGWYMVAGGAISLAMALDAVAGFRGSARWICAAVALLSFGPLVAAGVGLIRRVRGALLVGTLAWLPLLLVFQIGRVGYAAFVPPSLQWKLWPDFGFSGSFGPSFAIYWDSQEQPFYYGVNLMALLASTYLGERAWRRYVRLRRVRKRQR